jgi:hypothetical protein
MFLGETDGPWFCISDIVHPEDELGLTKVRREELFSNNPIRQFNLLERVLDDENVVHINMCNAYAMQWVIHRLEAGAKRRALESEGEESPIE